MTTTDTPTRQDVEALKRGWLEDPCWDIFETGGYEAYREELRAFQQQHETAWEAAREQRLRDRAARLGCPGNTALVTYLDQLEYRLQRLGEKVDRMDLQIDYAPERCRR